MSYTMEFIFTAVIMAITLGAFIALIVVENAMYSKPPVVKWFTALAIMATIGCLVGGGMTLDTKNDDEQYNGGYCTECGYPYRFAGAENHKASGSEYYWTCDNCGNTISVGTFYDSREN